MLKVVYFRDEEKKIIINNVDPDPNPLGTWIWIRFSKGVFEDLDLLLPNVDPRIRIWIRIQVKMRWIRKADFHTKKVAGRYLLKSTICIAVVVTRYWTSLKSCMAVVWLDGLFPQQQFVWVNFSCILAMVMI